MHQRYFEASSTFTTDKQHLLQKTKTVIKAVESLTIKHFELKTAHDYGYFLTIMGFFYLTLARF